MATKQVLINVRNYKVSFFDHNGIKPEINYRKETEKNHKYVKVKQHVTEQPIGRKPREIKKKKIQNLEMDKFLETYNPPRVCCEETDSLNRPITTKSVIKNLPINKKSRIRQLYW